MNQKGRSRQILAKLLLYPAKVVLYPVVWGLHLVAWLLELFWKGILLVTPREFRVVMESLLEIPQFVSQQPREKVNPYPPFRTALDLLDSSSKDPLDWPGVREDFIVMARMVENVGRHASRNG